MVKLQKQEVFVLGFNLIGPFTNKETGEIIEGVNVYYIEKTAKDTNKQKGYIPSKIFLSKEKATPVLKNGTGIYNIIFRIELNGSKPRLYIEGFEFNRKVELRMV